MTGKITVHEASNYDLADIREGTEVDHRYRISDEVYAGFLASYGDLSPVHVDDAYAAAAGFRRRVMHGAILNGFISHFVGMVFPGRRALLLSVNLRYAAPCYLGDELVLRAKVDRVVDSQRAVLLNLDLRRPADATVVATGTVQVKVRSEPPPTVHEPAVKNLAAVVTGGTQGLGRALTLAFGTAGYEVLALYQRDTHAARLLEAELTAAGIVGRTVQHDVTHDDFPEVPTGKQLVLINNAAAYFEPKPLHLIAWEEMERSLVVALKGSFVACRALLRPMLKAGGGTIVNVLSSAVHFTPKGFAAYIPAKLALQGLTRSLAAEYAQRGLRVFSVSPGFMDTRLTSGWSPQLRAAMRAAAPMRTTETYADSILKLVLRNDLPARGEDYLLS
jgi:NAD(P)-dependent dehydrogenase (short-subunit alcohol dehydrogenase family)/acyl dehydratase